MRIFEKSRTDPVHANPLATVTVNGIAAARQSDYFYKELSEDNSAGLQWIEATITDGTTTTNGSLSLPAIATSPVHDDDGNLKADGEWSYAWDAENRLIGCERSAAALAAGAPYHREKHDYDSQSRRIRTTIFINSGTTPSSQTLYIFDGWKCVAELDGTGQPIRKYTWGLDLANRMDDASTGNVGALLWLVDAATGKTHIHLYDKNGNVSGLVDTTTRKRSATYVYDAFGQLITCYGDYAKSNPFTFSTKFTDFATGLRYYGYRWYGAKDGRWLTRDPISEDGGISLYGFVNNDGLNAWDRLGLDVFGFGPGELPGPAPDITVTVDWLADFVGGTSNPIRYYPSGSRESNAVRGGFLGQQVRWKIVKYAADSCCAKPKPSLPVKLAGKLGSGISKIPENLYPFVFGKWLITDPITAYTGSFTNGEIIVTDIDCKTRKVRAKVHAVNESGAESATRFPRSRGGYLHRGPVIDGSWTPRSPSKSSSILPNVPPGFKYPLNTTSQIYDWEENIDF